MSAQSGKAWRKAHPDKYRAYMRNLMRKRRAAANLATNAPAPEPLATRVEVEPVSVVEEMAGTAALRECVAREPMTQRRWKKMSELQRRRHLADIGVDSQEKMVDYLDELPE